MKQIRKNREPASLTLHRRTAHSNYENYDDKDVLRDSLCSEQRGICCYCMGKLVADPQLMKVEHFQNQTDYPDQQLIYSNMLGGCRGNEGQPKKEQHCDTYKGDEDMTFNPALRVFEESIIYHNNGEISSTNDTLDDELNRVLNLNVSKLKKARKGVLDGFKQSIAKIKGEKQLQKVTLEKWLFDWRGDDPANNLKPYCMVVVYWINKRLGRA